jgi:hypothetical protein
LEPLLFSPPFLPLVKFRPCCARFEPSNVYGPVLSAIALVIAYHAGHLCPSTRACQPQIASRLIVARWLGRYGFEMAGCEDKAMADLSARRNLLSRLLQNDEVEYVTSSGLNVWAYSGK